MKRKLPSLLEIPGVEPGEASASSSSEGEGGEGGEEEGEEEEDEEKEEQEEGGLGAEIVCDAEEEAADKRAEEVNRASGLY